MEATNVTWIVRRKTGGRVGRGGLLRISKDRLRRGLRFARDDEDTVVDPDPEDVTELALPTWARSLWP